MSNALGGGTDTTTTTTTTTLPTIQQAETSSTSISSESLPRSVRKNGRFIIPWSAPKQPGLGRFLKWTFTAKNNTNLPSKQELEQTLPVVKPNLDDLNQSVDTGIRVTWIGHATALIQMESLNILTDPIFSARCAPVQFAGPKRFRPVPCSVHELPRIDAVVISHNHYDHLDTTTVHALNARFGGELRWFVGLGLAEWMHGQGCDNVIELDWWQENCITSRPEVRFVFTPAQHWCKRSPTDDNKALWGSWCVIGPKQRFYFAGDTGYCSIFELIGKKYGPFDLAAIPIGAYEPRWFMESQHVDPEQAVRIHQDIQAKKSLAIHWGTFALANEFYLEPPDKLRKAVEEAGLAAGDFFTLQHGETLSLPPTPPTPAAPAAPAPPGQ